MTTEQTLANQLTIAQCTIKLAGADLSSELYNDLMLVEVHQALYLPAMFVLRFYSPDLGLFDSTLLQVGKEVEISMSQDKNPVKLLKGEITGLELDSSPLGLPTVTVRGYDKSHRLQRGRKTRTFLNVKDSDLFSKLSGEAGLSAQAVNTSPVHKYIIQNNETNYEFLQRRATRLGLEMVVDSQTGKLVLKKPAPQTAVGSYTWGQDLLQFRVRLSTNNQVDEVLVRGWDTKKKEAIVGTAASSDYAPKIGLAKTPKQLASSFGQTKSASVYRPVADQSEAQNVAKAILDDLNGRAIQVEGTGYGNPQVTAGKSLEIKEVGRNYSGKYYITSCIHRYSAEGYFTDFEANGKQSHTVLELTNQAGERGSGQGVYGPVVGIVTNVKPPADDAPGQVKVKFPWLPLNEGKEIESAWARLVTPMSGNGYGFYCLPEVNDEVLVCFEHGDLQRPYILGALWNGKDQPPAKPDNIVGSDGKVKQRIIKTRSGHIVTFDDSDDKPGISIVDKTGKNKIVIDSSKNDLTIEIENNVTVKAKKTITIESLSDNINLKTTSGKITLEAKDIELKGTASAKMNAATTEIKATASAKMEGATTEVKGSAALNLDGGAATTVKGGIIKLN